MNLDIMLNLPMSLIAFMSLAGISKPRQEKILKDRRKQCRRKDRRKMDFRRNKYLLDGSSDLHDKRSRKERRNFSMDKRRYERRALVRVMKITS